MRRAFIVACLTTATVAVSATASPSPVQLDRSHGVRFSLNGSVLSVGLVAPTDMTLPDTRNELWGKRIRAVCSPTFNYRKALRVAVRAVRLWPRGQTQLSYSFERDISDRVKWCLLEDAGGGDVAGVYFQVFVPVRGDTEKDRRIGRALRRYLWRNASSAPWLRRVTAIVVDRGVISVATQLRHNRRGTRSAREICSLIQGADVADFTPGHTILGHNDVVLRTCLARRE